MFVYHIAGSSVSDLPLRAFPSYWGPSSRYKVDRHSVVDLKTIEVRYQRYHNQRRTKSPQKTINPMDSGMEPIAVIGTACRFPGGADTPAKLWELLRDPHDVSSQIDTDRLSLDRFYGTRQGRIMTQRSYFLTEKIDQFDAQFFGISPAEAEAIDPQQRILLEVVYEALEAAGVPVEDAQGSDTAVYIGQMCHDYQAMTGRDISGIPTYHATGTAASSTANRLSYFFDWHGPSMVIDTACSSSLVALHLAVQQLRSGGSTVAVAAGTNLILDPFFYISMSNLNMLSPTGQSQMWDAQANGYARGEGVAAVLLKPLRLALRDGDHIECVIRETGINQDGRTQGITTPSGITQAQLIRDTYRRAGLDPTPENCQFFEAHGTGTQSGDPQEAQAIHSAFFGKSTAAESQGEGEGQGIDQKKERKLWVGSIKTVLGHSEGCAGLAGLLKAGKALQHAEIPPNLLFRTPNPKLEGFMRHLQVPTSAAPWPSVPDGSPRRASVNSFGFGGTNSHTILESFTHSTQPEADASSMTNLLPFVFSAASKKSLVALVKRYRSFLEGHPNTPLGRLSYTLCCRRSAFDYKASFAAPTVSELIGQMDDGPDELGIRSWPKMGSKLIEACPRAQQRLHELDQILQALPSPDRPEWTIGDTLTNCTDLERITDPVCSQTLCTAIQILLVDILYAAKVSFAAVVGHSSGEIAAAYAAGYLNADDCIRIAYYRGLHVSRGRAAGDNNKEGAMIAVGMSFESASSLCKQEQFVGRLAVAAWNSSSSVTLSGDEDAVSEVQELCEREKRFARRLRVGTAYHSHHMASFAGPYAQSMEDCGIEVREPPPSNRPVWFSSVDNEGGKVAPDQSLKSRYWIDNMRNTVCFYPAITCAIRECGPFHMAIEIGPHPALKGPALDALKQADPSPVPYISPLIRGQDDCQAFTAAIGSIWTNLGPGSISMLGLAEFTSQENSQGQCVPLTGLPGYAWEHDLPIWAESRMAKRIRTDKAPCHSLLGIRMVEGPEDEWRWHNMLKPKELPWILEHRIQDCAVFPATGFLLQAVEAVRQLADGRSVQQVEIRDLEIMRTAEIDDTWGLETYVMLSDIENHDDRITCIFASYAASGRKDRKLKRCARCVVEMAFEILNALPPTQPGKNCGSSLVDVNMSKFHDALQNVGYGYYGLFQGLNSLRRRVNYAEGSIAPPALPAPDSGWLFHPATLDSAIQSIFAAYSMPGDGVLRSLHVPTRISRIALRLGESHDGMKNEVKATSQVTDIGTNGIIADVNISDRNGIKMGMLEQIELMPVANRSPPNGERELVFETGLIIERPDGPLAVRNLDPPKEGLHQKAVDCQRVAFYYVRLLHEMFQPEMVTRQELPSHHKALLEFCAHVVDQVQRKLYPHIPFEWFLDSQATVDALVSRHADDIDFRVVCAAGQNMPAVIAGDETILEVLDRGDMLDIWYNRGMVVAGANKATAKMISQISQRFPEIRLLEIGAGTGGTTRETLPLLGDAFLSYTYTDISSTFLGRAKEKFEAYSGRMTFGKLDIGSDPVSQGFEAGFYDVISASNVLHATPRLEITLRNVRRLLKPGGYLVLTEIIGQGPLHLSLSIGGLPGWWLGRDDGRRYAPTVSLERWDELLRATGFSGVDTFTPIVDPVVSTTSVLVAQAIDEQISRLRRPLSCSDAIIIPDLLIIGGLTLRTVRMIEDVLYTLSPRCANIVKWESLDQVQSEAPPLPKGCTVLQMADLDAPVFHSLSVRKWENLKRVLGSAENIMWLTAGYEQEDPFSAMSIGFARSLAHEHPELHIQNLDIDYINDTKDYGRVIVDRLLQLHLSHLSTSDSGVKALWAVEPELLMKGDRVYIPRLRPVQGPNRRLESSHRAINESVCPSEVPVELQWAENGDESYKLYQANIAAVDGHRTVRIEVSLLKPMLGLGYDAGFHGVRSPSFISPVPDEYRGNINLYLALVASQTVKEKIQSTVTAGSNVLVHEPGEALASVLQREAPSRGYRLVFSTLEPQAKPGWMSLASKTDLKKLQKLSFFINMSPSPLDQSTTAMLERYLPAYCQWVHSSWFFSKRAFAATHNDVSSLQSMAPASLIKLSDDDTSVETFTTLPVEALLGPLRPPAILTVVDWNSAPTVPVTLRPADAGTLFRTDRTYWLAGLSGDMGWAICDWMADHGARCIIITSRNPTVPAEWKERHHFNGTVIETLPWSVHHWQSTLVLYPTRILTGFSSDITSPEDVKRTYDDICRAHPPITGVFSGAMIMLQQSFQLMDLDAFCTVLRPKVQGTLNLDQLFGKEQEQQQDKRLDFFVALSSTVAIIGNPGQTAYAAANMFVKSLMRQRRSHGLAGFAVDLPPVLGVGSVHRDLVAGNMSAQKQERLARTMVPITTAEIHQLFAEAIASGRPNSTNTASHEELVAGLPLFTDPQEFQDVLLGNRRFSHLLRSANESGDTDEDSPGAGNKKSAADSLRIKARLAAIQASDSASKDNEIQHVIQQGLIAKTSRTLQLRMDAIDETKALTELGLDSLSVVDIRNWLRAEADAEISVFQILAGMSIDDIIEEVMQTSASASSSSMESDLPTPLSLQGALTPHDTEDSSPESISILNYEVQEAKSSCETFQLDEDQRPSPLTSDDGSCAKAATHVEEHQLHEVRGDGQDDLVFDRVENMSPAQEKMWFAGEYRSDIRKYNITMMYQVLGEDFHLPRFEKAVSAAVHRHPMLRTALYLDEKTGELHQGRLAVPHRFYEHFQLSRAQNLSQIYEQAATHRWRLDRGEVLKAFSVSDPQSRENWLIFAYHHIIMDGMSWRVFLRDLDEAYRGLPLSHLQGDFMDYTGVLREAMKPPYGSFQRSLEFWKDELSPLPEPMPLLPWAHVRSRHVNANDTTSVISRNVSAHLVQLVSQASSRLRGTAFHFHLTTFQVVLARILQISQFCVGVVDANRRDERFADTVGVFVQELPLQCEVDQSESFATVFKRSLQRVLKALSHGEVPLEVILDRLSVPRSASHTPLFQVVFNYRMGEFFQLPLGNDASLQYLESRQVSTPYEISFDVTHTSGAAVLDLTYQQSLYAEDDMGLFLDLYIHALEEFAASSTSTIESSLFHSPQSMEESIRLGRAPVLEQQSMWPDTIMELFGMIVEKCGSEVAVVDNGGSWSYSQLALRAHHAAAELAGRGVHAGSRVAVLCEPSVDVIFCMLAAFQIGAAYVPLDLSLPAARHKAILTDSQPDILCYHAATKERLADLVSAQSSWGLLDLSEIPETSSEHPHAGHIKPKSCACMLYTSGSTGVPKGVQLSQSSILNVVAGMSGSPEWVGTAVLQQSSLGFDMSLAQIFHAILKGGKLVVVPQDARGDPAAISQLMESEAVTLTFATPSEYQLLLEHQGDVLQRCSAWRLAATGGEPFNSPLKRQFQQLAGPGVVDCYGPTEITMCSTMRAVQLDMKEVSGNVGFPIANTRIFVLDANQRPMPVGLSGEICIAGAGVSSGYVDPALDRGKFVECPFDDGGKMYCTGDRGRLLRDGSLVFLGRMGTDNMVKVRGLRVDLDKIAASLANTAPETISHAVVTVRGTEPGSEFLVAHVVLRRTSQDHNQQTEADLVHLLDLLPLPRYMRPTRIIPLQRLPISSSHKVDRRAIESMPLPFRHDQTLAKATNKPLTLGEMALHSLWRDILPDLDGIAPDIDFFAAGGNSTLLVRLQAAIKNSIRCSIPLGDLYRATTLRSMAALVEERQAPKPVKNEDGQEEMIDWDRETMRPNVAPGYGNDRPIPNEQQGFQILMTGASSLLGQAILVSLLHDTRVSSPKVLAYPGSLRQEALGLPQATLGDLAAQVHMIIHAGAEGTCMNRYDSLREANVNSTRWLVSLASSLEVPFHYISYGSVIRLSGKASYPPVSLATHRPSPHPADGFLASKWASECIVEAMAQDFQLRGFIHRPCSVLGDQALSTDALGALVHYSRVLRAVPELSFLEGFIDLRDAVGLGHEVAQACLRLQYVGEQEEKEQGHEVEMAMFRHYSTGVRVPTADFRQYIQAQVNEPVVDMSYSQWAPKAAEKGMDPDLVEFVQWKIDTGKPILLPYLGEKSVE
ncbi:unnamed protein product [Penicillium salamii]|uniref:Uncharacterized protein n=1 Tax=Penicillium salamii TaxID=1612424 RepID=A0A9W4K2Z4_9EURO|nr:unnamed protein product [Penicillium salamii]